MPGNVGSKEGLFNQEIHDGPPLAVVVGDETARVVEAIHTVEKLSRPRRNDESVEVKVGVELEEVQEKIGQSLIVPFSLVRPRRSSIIGKNIVLVVKRALIQYDIVYS